MTEYAVAENTILTRTGAGIGYLMWRRPRFAKITAAVGGIVLGPYLIFTTPVINRYQRFAENVVNASEQLQRDSAFGDGSWSNNNKS